MKSKITFFCLFYVLILNAQKNKDLTIKILSKKIVENQNVDFVIKNHTKENYYILVDTLFLADAKYDNDYFLNPYFVLEDKKNNEVLKISDISEKASNVDLNNNQSFTLVEIKSREKLYFKLQFKVKRNISNQQTTYFLVDRKEKYYASLKYKLSEMFVDMSYVKKIIESLKKKDYKVFTGAIESNKIPVVFAE
ncbi:hypothetical protein [Flavobacterium sp. KACC 22763]|uniref:hypothetical protein n=1 Tax=Flavobacterium sp. KACC 22763 TaxID=3025668 RepID=UPI002365F60A|nr:hypothetical protein [Flavobacterium sp. KACC 22763]WDF65356.1 hypothetical protein PQ463_04150 [Flavobacterium sp. KACC 22763]